jgi:hypothetical protein
MNYEIITVEYFGHEQDYVLIANDDGSFVSFSVDELNPNYVSFLQTLEDEQNGS